MTTFFACLILIPLLAFVLVVTLAGVGIFLLFLWGFLMLFIRWLFH